MKNRIQDLWRGALAPQENQETAHSRYLERTLEKTREALAPDISDSQKELLEKYDSTVKEIWSDVEEKAFIKGFRLGVRMVVEGLSED